MLPFLKAQRKSDGIATVYRSPDEGKEPDHADEGLIAAAADLLKAVESKDSRAIAAALKAAFEICDSAPHHEGEHIE